MTVLSGNGETWRMYTVVVDRLPPALGRVTRLVHWRRTWPLACGDPSLQED